MPDLDREQRQSLTAKYEQYAAINAAWMDAPLPAGCELHAQWLLDRMKERREAGLSSLGHGYALHDLHFLANDGWLLDDIEFLRLRRAGQPIPLDPID